MRPLTILALLVALAGAKPGPDTALTLKPKDPTFQVRVVERPSCPPSFDLELTADMPDPGWSLAVDRVGDPDETLRRVVEITARREDGLFPQVITARTAKIPLGILRKGVYLIDVQLRQGAGKYERVQAIVLKGAGVEAPR